MIIQFSSYFVYIFWNKIIQFYVVKSSKFRKKTIISSIKYPIQRKLSENTH